MSGFVTVKFRTATVDFYQDSIVSTFNDGKTNSFALIWNNTPEYRQIASDMGYGDDWYRYGQEHELAHHFIADNLGWAYSWALRPFKGKPGPWPDHIAWEEHIVNKFQRFCRTRAEDEFKVLHLVLRADLEQKAVEFQTLCEMVLDKKINTRYNHETGESYEIMY